MGQFQNGCLYIKYRSIPQQNKAEECKKPTDCCSSPGYSIANLFYKFRISLTRLRKPNVKISSICKFIFFRCVQRYFFRLSFFLFSDKHSSKTIWCANSTNNDRIQRTTTLFQKTALLPDDLVSAALVRRNINQPIPRNVSRSLRIKNRQLRASKEQLSASRYERRTVSASIHAMNYDNRS